MLKNLTTSLTLLFFLVVIVCGIYPGAVWLIGQTIFPFQANASILFNSEGVAVGSKLIAQPFVQDEYFHSRPSAASYDASASASSALGASNYALRDRIARSLGPIVKYQDGKSVAPDIEKWFQQDRFQSKPNIVAQWATRYQSLAKAWVNANPMHTAYVDHWIKTHPDRVVQFIKDHPTIQQPKAADFAHVFFQNFSKENPGKFLAVNATKIKDKIELDLKPVNSGLEIQAIFFDMWRQEHPEVVLQNIPGDFVTTSASGLDPHITLQNAEFQLDRVVNKWAAQLKQEPTKIKKQIEAILLKNAEAPLAGFAGEKFINVLEVNLEISKILGITD
jgi:K+-transporting ATPase ATPase C chain